MLTKQRGMGAAVVKPMPFDFSNKSKLPETTLPKAKRGPKSFLATPQPHDKRHATDWLKRRSLLSRVLEQAKSQLVISNNYRLATEMVQVGILPSTNEVWRPDPCMRCPARAGWGKEGGRAAAGPTPGFSAKTADVWATTWLQAAKSEHFYSAL